MSQMRSASLTQTCAHAGDVYLPIEGRCANPLRPCNLTTAMLVAAVVRAAVYGTYILWHLLLIFQGSRDMARMPMSTFR